MSTKTTTPTRLSGAIVIMRRRARGVATATPAAVARTTRGIQRVTRNARPPSVFHAQMMAIAA